MSWWWPHRWTKAYAEEQWARIIKEGEELMASYDRAHPDAPLIQPSKLSTPDKGQAAPVTLRCEVCSTPLVTLTDYPDDLTIGCPACTATPRDGRAPCPVCSGDEGAVMHVNCILR